MNNRGFTIIELIIVIAILGILSSIGIPSLYKLLPHYRLNGAVRELVSDLRWARSIAITSGEKVILQLDPSKERYQIGMATAPEDPIKIRDYKADYLGIDLVSSSGGNQITFEPRGTTSSWTTIRLRNPLAEEKKITVIATGRIKIN